MSVYLTLTLPVYNLETRANIHMLMAGAKRSFCPKPTSETCWCVTHTLIPPIRNSIKLIYCTCVCVIYPRITQLSVITQDRLKLLINTWALTGSARVFRHLGVILPTLTYFVTRHAFVQPVYFLKRLWACLCASLYLCDNNPPRVEK